MLFHPLIIEINFVKLVIIICCECANSPYSVKSIFPRNPRNHIHFLFILVVAVLVVLLFYFLKIEGSGQMNLNFGNLEGFYFVLFLVLVIHELSLRWVRYYLIWVFSSLALILWFVKKDLWENSLLNDDNIEIEFLKCVFFITIISNWI